MGDYFGPGLKVARIFPTCTPFTRTWSLGDTWQYQHKGLDNLSIVCLSVSCFSQWMEQKKWHWHWHWNFSRRMKDFIPTAIWSFLQVFLWVSRDNSQVVRKSVLEFFCLIFSWAWEPMVQKPSREVAGFCCCWWPLWDQAFCLEGHHCSCSLQLYSPCQTPLVCCGYRNRGNDPSLPAWLCLAATVSVVPRISPELSLKLVLWLSVLTPLSIGDQISSTISLQCWQELAKVRRLWQGQKVPLSFIFSTTLLPLALQNSSHHQPMQIDATEVTSPPFLQPGLAQPGRLCIY